MADQWFYARGGQQTGPVTFAQLTDVVRAGGLTPNDLVWLEGTPEWQPAGQVPGLFGAVAAAAPANVPPPPAGPYAPPGPYSPPSPYAQHAPGQQVPAYAQPYGQYTGQSYENDARSAMICSIIGIFCFGIVLGPVGIVLGSKAKQNMRASGNMAGEGMATAAIVIGWIIVGLAVLGILIFILAAALGA